MTRAVACAADATGDRDVVRVRTFDLFAAVCASCNACASNGRCTRHNAALDAALERLAAADHLIVGTSGHLHARDARALSLLVRLVGGFGHVEVARGLRDNGFEGPAAHKRAAIVCAAPAPLGVPAMLGMLPAGASGVWRVLERAGTTVVGCATVGTVWAGPSSWDRASEPARALGRKLAAAGARKRPAAPAPACRAPLAAPARARLAPVLTGAPTA